ncbi:hypothetical protein BJX70DRAFT_392706 [Aspergillus crustosus]
MEKALRDRAFVTAQIYADPHNPHLHLERGLVHEQLRYPDLASADAYRALSLLDSVVAPDECEFHARKRVEGTPPAPAPAPGAQDDGEEDEDDDEGYEPIAEDEYNEIIGPVYALLVRTLVHCGCLRDAYEFALRGRTVLDELPQSATLCISLAKEDLEHQISLIKKVYYSAKGEATQTDEEINPSALKAQGFARRVLYPWNTHEPDRKSPETLNLLNERLKDVAPKCEVRAVALPVLHNTPTSTTPNEESKEEEEEEEEEVSIQLGLFAKCDLLPGETILHESSLLTATNRLHDDLCDACNGPLPDLSAENPPVACEECSDIIFCSADCHDRAQEVYHGAVCGLMENLESIGKDIPDPKDKADYLYLLLLGRAVAMAATQEVHPLELPEIKYIWGDFDPSQSPEFDGTSTDAGGGGSGETKVNGSLPFSFHLNILQPMRLIEEMQLDPYRSLDRYDTWVFNTLYAKFRGTASGRLSTWDGGPELCAVHPLWCLANHSCDPNVRWEWGGEIAFVVREEGERVKWKKSVDGVEEEGEGGGGAGVKKDEEILNHYCDVGLNVKERREWAAGALGGKCLCRRCLWEAGEVEG